VLAALLALAGCGAPGVPGGTVVPGAQSPLPRQAILYRDTVTVQFFDGALCVARRPTGARTWAGQLAGCPHMLSYEVMLPPGPQAPRRVLVQMVGGGVAVLSLPQTRFALPGPA